MSSNSRNNQPSFLTHLLAIGAGAALGAGLAFFASRESDSESSARSSADTSSSRTMGRENTFTSNRSANPRPSNEGSAKCSSDEDGANCKSDEDSGVCCICKAEPSKYGVIPCGHKCLCKSCSDRLMQGVLPKCPICRGPASRMQVIYSC